MISILLYQNEYGITCIKPDRFNFYPSQGGLAEGRVGLEWVLVRQVRV